MHAESYIRPPLIHGAKTYEQITNDIARSVEAKPSRLYWIVLTITSCFLLWGLFAMICAGLFPIFHMGRVWLAFFNLPYPNTRGPVWPNFNSALMWDVFAISTYFSVSLMFWYTGLIPDIATIRDRAKKKIAKTFY